MVSNVSKVVKVSGLLNGNVVGVTVKKVSNLWNHGIQLYLDFCVLFKINTCITTATHHYLIHT